MAPALVLPIESRLELRTREGEPVDVARYASIFCVVRDNGVPVELTFWDVSGETDITVAVLLGSIRSPTPGSVAGVAAQRPSLTVGICSRNRPAGLRRVLESLARQSDADFTVLVVDNDAAVGETKAVVGAASGIDVRYVRENQPGLSKARNRGLAAVSTDCVAWLDDDELADPKWVEAIRAGFAHPCSPAAVAGLMLPAELETEAQVRFEQYGGFNKGRGLTPTVLKTGTDTVLSPLFPLPNFGAGGNMAFRTGILCDIGGFDPRLGAGTLTSGGEETKAFAQLLQGRHAILHWPNAITWHYHRRDMSDLHRQIEGYGAGLTAFYMSMLREDPRNSISIAKLVSRGVKEIVSNRGRGRNGDLPLDFPPDLLRASRRGVKSGGRLYIQESRRQRAAKIGE